MNATQREDFARFHASVNGSAPELVGVLASEVVPERVTWLWSGRLALGKISMLDGNPGLGKSTLALDIAARVSTGAPFPGQESHRDPAGVVVLSAEDGVADTIVPRLKEAGANMDRVYILRGVKGLDGTEMGITIPADLAVIAQAITMMSAQLLIMDPLMAYFGSEINANRDQDVRRALAPLASLLEEHGCASWLVRHLTKAESKEALYRGGGSIGIIGAARFGSIVARDPDNPDACIVASEKCNIGPDPPSLRYRLVGVLGTDVARVVWDGEPSRWSAIDLLDSSGSEEERAERSECEQWLYELLSLGSATYTHIMKERNKYGYSEKAIRRAKSKIGAQHRREGGFAGDGHSVWFLPNMPDSPDTGNVSNNGKLGHVSVRSSSYVNKVSSNIPGHLPSMPNVPYMTNLPGIRDEGHVSDDGTIAEKDLPWMTES